MAGTSREPSTTARAVNLAVIVAALGYFVDIYDLLLFSVIRIPSLKGIGVAPDQVLTAGADLITFQMLGMLFGGVLWGVLGDRRGRLSVLFGSIILYSLANIANGFVHTLGQYHVLRLIAGIGLAGELGAGITLVAESIDRRRRGYATTIVATVGICGALVAVVVSKKVDWRTAYFIGGGLGLALLALRVGVYESGLFKKTAETGVTRGNFFALFSGGRRTLRYISVILTGVPIWYFVGILVTFAPEMGKAMGMDPVPQAADAVFWSYLGLVLGDFGSGAISQVLRSRRRALGLFIALTAFFLILYFTLGARSVPTFYLICFLLGISTGYWAVFVTIASEQFGTNLRATVTTTVPNFVRGLVPVLVPTWRALSARVGLVQSAIVVGAVTVIVAFVCVFGLEETYGKDLDFIER
jgi:MFS transporter, putative metabolite:H+ symporter